MAMLTTVANSPFERAALAFERMHELVAMLDNFADRAIGSAPRPVNGEDRPASSGQLGRLEEQADNALETIARAEDILRGLNSRFGFTSEAKDDFVQAAKAAGNVFGDPRRVSY